MIAPINNLINAHAPNFVSAEIGNTPAFIYLFFFFCMAVIISSIENLHILIYHKIRQNFRYQEINFMISKNQICDIKKSIFCKITEIFFDIKKSIFDIKKSSLFFEITKSIL